MRSLRQLEAVFDKLLNSDISDRVKVLKLKGLLKELSKAHNIPDNISENYIKENPAVVNLYRKIFTHINDDY